MKKPIFYPVENPPTYYNIRAMRPSFFHHLHPPTIPARQARFRYTLGAGGLSVYLCVVLILSGMLEMFYYVPTPEAAGASIQTIVYLVPFGAIIRNLHYLAGQFLVIVSGVHMLRVIFTGAYATPRRFNYWLGLSLFVLILFMDFTGYILRWDEGIRWALVAGTNLIASIPLAGSFLYKIAVGGQLPGAATLLRFYTWHIFGLTALIVFIFAWHIFRVRRDGGIAVPPPELRIDSSRITRFDLVRREGLAVLIATALLIILAALIPAPLAAPITSGSGGGAGADARAPWFFLWVQQMLKLGDAFIFGVLIPAGVLALLAAIPLLPFKPRPEELGCWFPRSARPVQILVGVIVLAIIGLTALSFFVIT